MHEEHRLRVRIAAVGDLHVAEDAQGRLRPHFATLDEHADILLLAGDLTHHGTAAQARVLAAELRGVPVPVIAVLGNHDYHAANPGAIQRALEDVGVTVLEGESIKLSLGACTLGVAGIKGFGGGFADACGHKFGEPEMKAFVQITEDAAQVLEENLRALDTDWKVALLHYAPVKDTVAGERLEIFPFLGAYQLGYALDRGGAHLAFHGHAHHGAKKGLTPGGVPVHNVAMPLIKQPYAVFTLDAAGVRSAADAATGARAMTSARAVLPT
jgi:Icc-related predicted phosphoesterase